eukprot:CAMPEP_0179334418 /NCGR_PEP_ID=MMETSP0797-20121207/65928_1 /TAXON_ID=47934 /ORGANISM="Dinophysis acuminata, Strain DAEP01" /LENGTH=36 /DNA_ID= /DNA_START= /DNA_END= /DNA_ORIENTATION=
MGHGQDTLGAPVPRARLAQGAALLQQLGQRVHLEAG